MPKSTLILVELLILSLPLHSLRAGQQNVPQDSASQKTIRGIVTDSHCKCTAKMIKIMDPKKKECARTCVDERHAANEKAKKEGREPQEELVYGICEIATNFYVIDPQNQQLAAKYSGQEVSVTGFFQKGRVMVASISPRDAGPHKVYLAVGYISDSQCAMMGSHAKMIAKEGMADKENGPATCTRNCVKMGGKYVLVDPAKKTVYELDDQQKPDEFAGQKVKVTGTYDKATKTIHVTSIQAAS